MMQIANQGTSVTLQQLLALQHFAGKLPLFSNKRSTASQHGDHQSRIRGRGIDFDEVRAYQAGDDMRFMHWGVTARTGQPHIKLYHEERERPVLLVTDLSPSMHFATKVAFKSVVAAQLAAILAWTAKEHGERVGGIVFDGERIQEFAPRGRKQGILPLFKALSEQTQHTPPDCQVGYFEIVLRKLRHLVKPGSIIFFISDFYNLAPCHNKHLQRLAAHNDLFAIQVYDQIEREPPPPQSYSFSDGKSICCLTLRNHKQRAAYQAQAEARQQQILQQLFSTKLRYGSIATHQSLQMITRPNFWQSHNFIKQKLQASE